MSDPDSIAWFAIQARPGAEGVAEAEVRSLHVESLLPLASRIGTRSRLVPRRVVRALFPGYFFARFSPALSLRAIRYSRGVVRVLGCADRPLPVEDAIIESLRTRMDARGCVELDPPGFKAGEAVRIHAGPLAGWSGVFERDLNDSRRVVILLETLQAGRAVVWRDWVEHSSAA